MVQCNVIEGAIIGRHDWKILEKIERRISDESIFTAAFRKLKLFSTNVK
jgi:hypothetical protein